MITNYFEFHRPSCISEALELLAKHPGAVVLAGGTDLLGTMKRSISTPEHVVSIGGISELSGIQLNENGEVTIGCTTTLSNLTTCEVTRGTALSCAAAQVATPQIRNTATVAGNLLQAPRCMYYRHPDFACVRKGGSGCLAVSGRNRYNAIYQLGTCRAAHPSDIAPVLIALNARAVIQSETGRRELSCDQLYQSPAAPEWRDTALAGNELLVQIRLPELGNTRTAFVKLAERKSIDFAQVSVAGTFGFDGNSVTSARIVGGAIACIPIALNASEELLIGKTITAELIDQAADAACAQAKPLGENSYKVDLLAAAVKKVIRSLAPGAGNT